MNSPSSDQSFTRGTSSCAAGAEARSFPLRLLTNRAQGHSFTAAKRKADTSAGGPPSLPHEETGILLLRDAPGAGGETSREPAKDDGNRGDLEWVPASVSAAPFGQ